jgi:phosphatidate phosphatase APP1
MLRAMATNAPPLQLVTYRGMLHPEGCTLSGRVLRRPLHGGPRSDDGWWRNLRNTWRRFDSEPVAGVAVELGFRGARGVARSDEEGYWSLTLPGGAPAQSPWGIAEARPAGQDKVFLQPVLCVPPDARFGVLSDIDDTVLESNVTDWQTAAQLTFLHNARTRKPLEGVAGLYQALQKGRDGQGFNPLFYVSASPWNLYDLLEDFLTLNDIPPGPLMLRDVDLDRASWRGATQAQSKVESMELLMRRYPGLRWVLVGDSGQVDAELYAGLVLRFPGSILAVYIRDVDPATDSERDRFVDRHIGTVAGTGVPMLRVRDSNAIAAHARELGLLPPAAVPEVAQDVRADHARPELKDAVKEGTKQAVAATLTGDERHRGR